MTTNTRSKNKITFTSCSKDENIISSFDHITNQRVDGFHKKNKNAFP